MATEDDKEKDEALQQLKYECARRRGQRSRGKAPLHAGGFARTAQCSRCSSYKTRTLRQDYTQRIRLHLCTVCDRRFRTSMHDGEERSKRVSRVKTARVKPAPKARPARKENPKKPARRLTALTLNGITRTIAQWASQTGISTSVIYGRLRLGWSIEDALSSSRLRTLTCNGVTASIREWSQRTGLSVCSIRSRMHRGWTDQQIIETPFRKSKTQRVRKVKPKKQARQKQTLTHDNRTMTIAQWASETGISVAVIYARLRLGWSISATLSTPVKTPHLILHDGRVQSAADWSRETGVKLQLILHRLQRGWTLQEIISTPAGVQRVKSEGDPK